MRAACRQFLNDVEGMDTEMSTYHRHRRWWDEDERNFFISLGELRAVMGIHIAGIAVRYGIDVEEKLAAIFPPSPGEL